MHELDGEALLYDPITADTHRLNSTAYFIWSQCDGRHDVGSIARRLTEQYDVAPGSACENVERTLRELRELNLFVPSHAD